MKFTSSQRALEEARSEIRFKTDKIHSLELKIEALDNDSKRDLQLAKEKAGNHNKCKKEIDTLKESINEKDAQINSLRIELEKTKMEFQQKIDILLKEKEEEHERYEERMKQERESMLKEVMKLILSFRPALLVMR